MKEIPFFKIHTNGNDFIFIESTYRAHADITDICNRHTGIGCDGLIFYTKEKSGFVFSYFNSDGASAPICGNSLISAGLLWRTLTQNLTGLEVNISGEKKQVFPYGEGKWGSIICPLKSELEQITLNINNTKLTGYYTKVPGNPHFIVDIDDAISGFDKFAEKIVKNSRFEHGVNAEFLVNKHGKNPFVLVYERGVGETLSCATGASAVYLYLKFIKGYTVSTLNFKGGKYDFFEKNGMLGLIAKPKIVATGYYLID